MKNTEQLRKPKIYQKKSTQGIIYGSRGFLLYLLPIALIPASILSFMSGNFFLIITNISGCASFLLAAGLLRRGIAAEKIYQDKKVARAPRPLKALAALIVAISTAAIAFTGVGHSFVVSIAFGLGALGGMILFYGIDPRQEKMTIGTHGYSAEEISNTLDEAEVQVSGIELANKQISNRDFNQRIRVICEHARDILTMLEEDPGDIRRARKFLNTYLDGALKVTVGYASMQNKHTSNKLTKSFENVLKTIESVFIEQKQKLLEDDVLDLDVQIEVLASQLKHEGVI